MLKDSAVSLTQIGLLLTIICILTVGPEKWIILVPLGFGLGALILYATGSLVERMHNTRTFYWSKDGSLEEPTRKIVSRQGTHDSN